ncbi:MAG: sugar phosphate nucleotidyltransferase [Candidatus Micrarchaeota archaeon]|nr:sugar phosphate nucleotidyltransferase [Candidatus Micrarchaeota archaeon]
MKEKIAFSIDAKLLKKVDSMVDGVAIKSRSHALETLIRKGLGEEVRHALILAGGEIKKNKVSKSMIHIDDKPVLHRIIDWLKGFGITRITISVGYRREEIESYFGSGKGFGVDIDYIREDEPLGTAGALYLARSRFHSTFVVAYSDGLCDFNLKDMVELHRKWHSVATIALKEVADPTYYGAANLEGNRITNFIEKPESGKSPSRLANAGVYVFEPEIFDYVKQKGKLETDTLGKLVDEGIVHGYVFSGEWIDVSRR